MRFAPTMAFFDEYYPESPLMVSSRETLHVVAFVDLVFTILFIVTYLLTLGLHSWWIGALQFLHIVAWAFALGVSDARNNSFSTNVGFFVFAALAVIDASAIIVRFFYSIWLASSVPWVDVILLSETLLLLVTSVIMLFNTLDIVTGIEWYEANCQAIHTELQYAAQFGRATAATTQDALRALQQQQYVASAARARDNSAIVVNTTTGSPTSHTLHQLARKQVGD